MSTSSTRTVAIIGAGPVGPAAAAHAFERGLEPIVLESGPEAGHSVRQWSHVRMFSPWEYNIDKAAGRGCCPSRSAPNADVDGAPMQVCP